MKIVIFSTRLTDKGLFGGGENIPVKELFSFFLSNNFDTVLTDILQDKNKTEEVKKILIKYSGNVNVSAEADRDLLEMYKKLGRQSTLTIVMDHNINDEINKRNKQALLKRITEWDLKDEVIKIAANNSRSELKKLKGQQVYAIQCLEYAERNDQWIPTLVKSAEIIANENSSQLETLYLVLHDKDEEYFEGKDAYICNEDEVKKLLKENDIGDCEVKIAFFSHTINKFVKILEPGLDDTRNIILEVTNAFDYYKHFQELIDNSKNWLNGMGESDSTDNYSWITELDNINNELKKYD